MIFVITDRKLCKIPFLEQIEKIAAAGPDMIILREKDLSEKEYRDLAKKCLSICDDHEVPFCVNTFVDVALEINADNMQLSMDGLKEHQEELDEFDSVGVSVHSLEEALEAADNGADFAIYGNVFETQCKLGAPGKGLDSLRGICSAVNIPVFGVGGINADNAPLVIKSGAEGVCMMSAMMTAENPARIVDRINGRC